MPSDCVSYQKTGYFSPLIVDYLNGESQMQHLYNRLPKLENFEEQIAQKQNSFSDDSRALLVKTLKSQYQNTDISDSTQNNIDSLAKPGTFTITTGHQLNIFSGPLYFLYKIISAINLAGKLQEKYPSKAFVPVYWMATEDHDFEEINHFHFKGRTFSWNRDKAGPTGRLSTQGLENVLQLFDQELGIGKNADELRSLFTKAYLEHDTLSEATRYLANELFGKYGIVIIDADDSALKSSFIASMKRELLYSPIHQHVSETITKFNDYTVQVNPREINLFYMEAGYRERIIKQDDFYYVNNTPLKFTESEILEELQKNPQRFSPNVLMRPLYQEVLLPNLCYIGGGAEIAYWLELKSYFESEKIPFPILLLRNSVLLATEKQSKKLDNLNLTWRDMFLKPEDLITREVHKISEFPIDLTSQKEALQKQFAELLVLANHTDESFTGAVLAQQAKQIKGLENLEKRLLKAQKRKHADQLQRLTAIHNELFPNHTLQERHVNFSEFYVSYGSEMIEKLVQQLDPFSDQFNVVVL